MTRTQFSARCRAVWLAGFLFLVGVAGSLSASDHADPVDLLRTQRKEGRITDLFVFPAQDKVRRVPVAKGAKETRAVTNDEANRLEIIFCVRPALTASPPFAGLDQFKYKIFADLHSANADSFTDPYNTPRYGGTVKRPEDIGADFSITFSLDNMAKIVMDEEFKNKGVLIKEGGEWKRPRSADRITWHSDVHDDPFIFPMFFGTNVIAVVISVPLDCFPAGHQDFLFWATSHLGGEQIDHVGRSQRTQLPRFDALNTVHPKDHIPSLRKQEKDPGLVTDALGWIIAPPFKLRPTDFQPDVMFFTRRLPLTYPNGRQLEDDVAAMTCKQGDCQLYEVSFNVKDASKYPTGRPTTNDKDFKDEFPYLAAPWPDKDAAPGPALTPKNQTYVGLAVVVTAVVFLFPWVLYFWSKVQLWRLRATVQNKPAPPAASAPATAPPAPGGSPT